MFGLVIEWSLLLRDVLFCGWKQNNFLSIDINMRSVKIDTWEYLHPALFTFEDALMFKALYSSWTTDTNQKNQAKEHFGNGYFALGQHEWFYISSKQGGIPKVAAGCDFGQPTSMTGWLLFFFGKKGNLPYKVGPKTNTYKWKDINGPLSMAEINGFQWDFTHISGVISTYL